MLDLPPHRFEQRLRRALVARGLERERQLQELRVTVRPTDRGSLLGEAYDVVEPAVQERLRGPHQQHPRLPGRTQLLGEHRQCGQLAQQLHAPPLAGMDVHRPQPAPRLHLPIADGEAHRYRAVGQRQAVVRVQRVLEGGDARLDVDELDLRVGPLIDLDRRVLAEHVAGRLDLGRHPHGRLLPGRSGAAQQRERLAGERVDARAEQRVDRPADQRRCSRYQQRVGVVGAPLDHRDAAAHSVGHGTRGILRASLAELLAQSVLHAPTVERPKPTRRLVLSAHGVPS